MNNTTASYGSALCAGQEQPPETINSRLESLDKSLDSAFGLVDQIRDRFDRVLTPAIPSSSPSNGGGVAAAPPPRSSMQTKVKMLQLRVFSLREELQSLLNRAEV